jgi:C4-dicarboxylate transporter
MFNSLFLVFFEGYIEILLSCFLNNKSGVKITKSDKFSFFISYFFGSICLIIIPVSLLFMLSRNPETLDSKEAYKKYGSLYDGLNTKSRWCLLYNVLFIVRRLALLLIMFNKRLQDTNSLQILYLVYINFLIMMYVHIVNPFDTRRKNIIEKVNEACVFLSVEMMMFFTDML